MDDGTPRPGEWFDAFVRWAMDVLARPDAKVFMHSAMGSNRGPNGAFAVLLMLGWEPGAALELIRSQRPHAYAQISNAEDACLWFHEDVSTDTAQKSADYTRDLCVASHCAWPPAKP